MLDRCLYLLAFVRGPPPLLLEEETLGIRLSNVWLDRLYVRYLKSMKSCESIRLLSRFRVHTFRLERGNAKYKNIRHDEILGAGPGTTVDTLEGGQVTVHRLSLEDYIRMLEFGTASY